MKKLKTDKIKVMHLLIGLGNGGTEVLLRNVLKKTDKRYVHSEVVVLSDKKPEMLADFLDLDLKVKLLSLTKSPISFFKTLRRLNKHFKETPADIVHAHLFHAMVFAVLLKVRYPKIKVVFTPHSETLEAAYREVIAFFLKPLRDIDALNAPSIKKYFFKQKNWIIPNGVEVDLDFKRDERVPDKFVFVALSRLEDVKNHQLLIKCAALIPEHYDFEIIFVGDGSLREKLEHQASQLTDKSRIRFLGFVKDPLKVLKSTHCLVLSSKWEGMNLSILEAGSIGLPVISTKVGYVPDILEGEGGYLTDAADFHLAMEYLMDNYPEATGKADKLRTKVEAHYSIQKVAAEHQALYQSLLS